MRLKSSLWWGALPAEPDGGAVVAFYQFRMMNYLEPSHIFHGIPKIPDYLDPKALPFMEFGQVDWFKQSDKEIYEYICQYMKKNNVSLLTLWHIPPKFFSIVSEVHKIGGKVLNWQTVHWKTDTFLKNKLLNDIDFWVAPTKWAKRQMIEVGGIKRDKIKYLPHAVNLEKFYPHDTAFRESLNLGKDQKVILVVGRCSLAKGLHQVIPVMRGIIRDYDAVFIIKAGAFQEIAKSKEIAYIINKMAKRSPNIYWVDSWKEPSFMEELMASCDILLQPSGHEGFDVPLIEAMACKKPVAVTNISNHWEIMGERNRYCGVFMEPTEDTLMVNQGTQMIKVPSSQMIEETLRFMLDNPDECYSDDTEVLSENGWKLFKDLPKNERLATLNPKTNKLEYQFPTKYIEYNYVGKLFRQKGRLIDVLVTPNHNLWVGGISFDPQLRRDKQGRFTKKLAGQAWGFKSAQTCPRYIKYKRNAIWMGKEQEFFVLPPVQNKTRKNQRKELLIPMDDWLQFFGIWLAEGSAFVSCGDYYVTVAQVKQDNVTTINSWLKKIPFHFRYDGRKEFICINKQLYSYLKQFGHAGDKYIPREILELSSRQLKILLDAMMVGDGTKDGRSYATKSSRLANNVQEIALKIGLAGSVQSTFDKQRGYNKYNVGLSKKELEPVMNEHTDNRSFEEYSGMVYCVVVPNHIIYVRRNGKACWCGNCEAMAENGLKRVKKRYNLAQVASDWLDYLDAIIQ